MKSMNHSDVDAALQLIRSGRYLGAIKALQQRPPASRRFDSLGEALLADMLQRVGQNRAAEDIALRHLRSTSQSSPLYARYQYVLGNVSRDRGNMARALEHFQIAANLSVDDELAAWSELRLITAIGETSGTRVAMARLDDVRRILTRCGDPRPFAALHLWLVEAESTIGNIENAWRNLRAADTLLSQVDDAWLQGYLAVNRSAIHYYSAEIGAARRYAESAIVYAQESGHRTTRCAAHVNLGNIEFSQGQFGRAEQYLQTALDCSESGSLSEVIILENIAQVKLHADDLIGCRSVLSQLETLASRYENDKRKHYNRWALHTKIRLLLKEGKSSEARQISNSLSILSGKAPHARVNTASHLLNAETLLANQEPTAAANTLIPMFVSSAPLPPDLYAEMERITGNALALSGARELASIHWERARRTFDLIGHTVGRQRTSSEPTARVAEGNADGPFASQWCLDRLRALFDLRDRPELFGHEAVLLLQELACAQSIKLLREPENIEVSRASRATELTAPQEIRINLRELDRSRLILSFVSLPDPKSVLTAMTFRRIVDQVLGTRSAESFLGDQEVIWRTEDNSSVTCGFAFASNTMSGILRVVKQVAPTDVSVLITGETGTGKEVIAKTIHENSRRASMPFLALNCAAVSKELLESQLFGHRKGAFSGATENHPGIVRAANGGTLFLDEIGEIPLDMQAKLLRFLEMNEVHPVGETHPVKVNVRLIFATNGDLEEAVQHHRFRQDLFFRLNVIPIKVPPLRERREDIPVLVNMFAQKFSNELSKKPIRLSTSAMEHLILYSWPGNVRQLLNEVRRLTALMDSGAYVTPDDLIATIRSSNERRDEVLQSELRVSVAIDQSLEGATSALESEMIKYALRKSGGRVVPAASSLGVSRKGLYLKRRRLGLIDFDGRES